MAWSKAYQRITWVNEPSTSTPLNATNLNKMDVALNEVDNRVLALEGEAFVHIKYSAYATPTNAQMTDTPSVYMGICVNGDSNAPSTASSYTWNRVRGEKVLLQATATYIQWKYENDATWTNLVAISSLKGSDGKGIASVALTSGTHAAGTTDTYTITYTDGTTTTFGVYNGSDGIGAGDMTKATYDTNNNGIVDNAERLGNQLPSYYAKKSVDFNVSLTVAGWSANSQTVSNVNFVTAGSAYIVSPVSSSYTSYAAAQIRASDVSTNGQMTFTCSETPTAAITVNILKVEV